MTCRNLAQLPKMIMQGRPSQLTTIQHNTASQLQQSSHVDLYCHLNLKIIVKIYFPATILTLVHVSAAQAPAFNITAISAANNTARLECWQLSAPPVSGRGAVNFDLGNFENAFLGIIPPNTTAGTINNAVQIQYSLIMSGLAHITTPYSGLPSHLNEVWIKGGKYGWLIAADLKEVAAKGHITTFPGKERTVIAQFPVRGNTPPEHRVLHVGPCGYGDLEGL